MPCSCRAFTRRIKAFYFEQLNALNAFMINISLREPREDAPKASDWWNNVVPKMNEKHFKRVFRVPRKVFDNVSSSRSCRSERCA